MNGRGWENSRVRAGSCALGWITACIIIALNSYLVCWEIGDWITAAGSRAIWLELTVVPLAIACSLLLAWLMIRPWVIVGRVAPTAESAGRTTAQDVAARIAAPQYRRIGVALDHSPHDTITLEHAAALVRGHGAEMVLNPRGRRGRRPTPRGRLAGPGAARETRPISNSWPARCVPPERPCGAYFVSATRPAN